MAAAVAGERKAVTSDRFRLEVIAASLEASISQPEKTAAEELRGEASSTSRSRCSEPGMPAVGKIVDRITWNLFFVCGARTLACRVGTHLDACGGRQRHSTQQRTSR
jgi:hypothetical protein